MKIDPAGQAFDGLVPDTPTTEPEETHDGGVSALRRRDDDFPIDPPIDNEPGDDDPGDDEPGDDTGGGEGDDVLYGGDDDEPGNGNPGDPGDGDGGGDQLYGGGDEPVDPGDGGPGGGDDGGDQLYGGDGGDGDDGDDQLYGGDGKYNGSSSPSEPLGGPHAGDLYDPFEETPVGVGREIGSDYEMF